MTESCRLEHEIGFKLTHNQHVSHLVHRRSAAFRPRIAEMIIDIKRGGVYMAHMGCEFLRRHRMKGRDRAEACSVW